MDRGTAIHLGKRYPSRPATTPVVKPAPRYARRFPFAGGKGAPTLRHYLTFEECALEDGKWRWFVRTPQGIPIVAEDDYFAARLKLVECSLPNCLNLHIEVSF